MYDRLQKKVGAPKNALLCLQMSDVTSLITTKDRAGYAIEKSDVAA